MSLNLLALLFSFLLTSLPTWADDSNEKINEKLIQLGKYGASIGKNGCKRPNRIVNEPITNIHDPNVIDQLQTFHCPDWQITYYIAGEKTILQSVALTSTRPKLPNRVELGMSKESITEILGTPQETRDNLIYYWVPEYEAGGNDEIEFMFDRNKLSKITWQYFID